MLVNTLSSKISINSVRKSSRNKQVLGLSVLPSEMQDDSSRKFNTQILTLLSFCKYLESKENRAHN